MKKQVVLMSLVLFPVFARADFKFYGKAIGAMESSQNFRQPTALDANGKLQKATLIEDYGSYIGFKGEELVEGAGNFLWQIEQYVLLDDSTTGTGFNTFGNRDTFVGINGRLGTLRLGRLSNFPNVDMEFVDPYDYSYGSNGLINFVRLDGWVNGSLRYDSPMFSNVFKFMLMFAPDETKTGGQAKDIFNVGLLYKSDTFFAGYSYFNKAKTNAGTGADKWNRFEGGFDNGTWLVVLGYQDVNGYSATDLVYDAKAFEAQTGAAPAGEIKGQETALTLGYALGEEWHFNFSYAKGADMKVNGTTLEDSGYNHYVLGLKNHIGKKAYWLASYGTVLWNGNYNGTDSKISEDSLGLGLALEI